LEVQGRRWERGRGRCDGAEWAVGPVHNLLYFAQSLWLHISHDKMFHKKKRKVGVMIPRVSRTAGPAPFLSLCGTGQRNFPYNSFFP
jgi:hypothetical protein